MPNNANIIRKANETLTTTGVTSGLLNPEQAQRFMQQTFEATPLSALVRHEMRRAKSGEIDKIGIASRILRKKVENTDDGYRAKPNFGAVEYATTAVRLPWEITEETLRENIEGQGLEATITNLMTRQIGIDREDLCINGDAEYATEDADKEFLTINNGWVKQIMGDGHVVDRTSENAGAMSVDVFYDCLRSLPNKYNNGALRWLMSPHRRQEWERYILDKAITVGGIISDRRVENPVSIPAVEVPSMPDDKIILTNPQNLIVVNTYGVIIRKTTEGKEAIMQDKRFYVVHFDFDAIIEETDATAIITGLAAL
ncbi:hypothetical protein [Clostridium sp. D33t1_170424_F3]|uniref:hypothetical protein n=1 Tax=Clostridium sp. D33t1_170424_F3 TaxID=2787099 RepID=UPI0018ABE184|nr:hypothetical protein [Clostridium sp. D33t1_170424_F3]